MYPNEGSSPLATPLITAHYLTAAAFFLVSALLISANGNDFTGHHFHPTVLSVTHLLVLGFVSMVIFGALLQLLPVLLRGRLYSAGLGYATLLLLGVGTALLAYGFHTFRMDAWAIAGGIMVLLAVVCLSANVLLTTQMAPPDSGTALMRDFVHTAMLWLLLTVTLGLLLLLNLRHAFLSPDHLDLLRIHAHMGMAGWFLQLVMGLGSRLLPMFLVAHGLSDKPLQRAYYCLNVGLIIALIGLYLDGIWLQSLGAVLVTLSAGLFMVYLLRAFRIRVKRKLDPAMKVSMMAFTGLPLTFICLAILLSAGSTAPLGGLSISYVALYILGFLCALVMGQSYKTLPFIIWLKLKQQHPGRAVPLPATFYSAGLMHIQAWTFAGGILLFITGLLTQMETLIAAGGLGLSLAGVCYMVNMLRIVFFPIHKSKIPS